MYLTIVRVISNHSEGFYRKAAVSRVNGALSGHGAIFTPETYNVHFQMSPLS